MSRHAMFNTNHSANSWSTYDQRNISQDMMLDMSPPSGHQSKKSIHSNSRRMASSSLLLQEGLYGQVVDQNLYGIPVDSIYSPASSHYGVKGATSSSYYYLPPPPVLPKPSSNLMYSSSLSSKSYPYLLTDIDIGNPPEGFSDVPSATDTAMIYQTILNEKRKRKRSRSEQNSSKYNHYQQEHQQEQSSGYSSLQEKSSGYSSLQENYLPKSSLQENYLPKASTVYSTMSRRHHSKRKGPAPLPPQYPMMPMTRNLNMMDPRSVYGYVGPPSFQENARDPYFVHKSSSSSSSARSQCNFASTASTSSNRNTYLPSQVVSSYSNQGLLLTKSCNSIPSSVVSPQTIPHQNPHPHPHPITSTCSSSSYYASPSVKNGLVFEPKKSNLSGASLALYQQLQNIAHHNKQSSSGVVVGVDTYENHYHARQSQANLISSCSPPDNNQGGNTASKVASPLSSASTASSSVSSSHSSLGVKSNATATTPMFTTTASNSANSSTTHHPRNTPGMILDMAASSYHHQGHNPTNQMQQISQNFGQNCHEISVTSTVDRGSQELLQKLLSSHSSSNHIADPNTALVPVGDDNDSIGEGDSNDEVEAHLESMNGYTSSSEKKREHRSHHHRHHHHRKKKSSFCGEGRLAGCLRYTLLGVNMVASILGFLIMMIGFWAWNEKDYLSNLTNIPLITLDPAFALIVVGTVSFVIGMTGCLGALRENTCLLATYSVFILSLLLFELSMSVLAFILKDWIRSQASQGMQAFIVYYRDDPDRQNLIDWIQESWLECCGIDGPRDWDMNIYFNCSSVAQGSREACGVPFSCCRSGTGDYAMAAPSTFDDSVILKNKQCGYDVRKPDFVRDRSLIISEKGCLRAGEEWIEGNFLLITMSTLAIASLQSLPSRIRMNGCMSSLQDWFRKHLIDITIIYLSFNFLQILAICISQNLRADIMSHRLKQHRLPS